MQTKKHLIYLIVILSLVAVTTGVYANGNSASLNPFAADAAELGDPGFSLAYTGSYGVNGEPYVYSYDHINNPMGLFVDSSYSMYVAELEGARVMKFDGVGNYQMSFGEVGNPYHHDQYLYRPSSVEVDGSGHVWVVYQSAIKEYDADGNMVQIFPADAPWEDGDSNDRLNNPFEGVFSNDGSQFFVSDTNNQRIQVFTFDGDGLLTYDSTIEEATANFTDVGFFNPQGLSFDSSGRLYVADFLNYRIVRCEYNGGTSQWDCSNFVGETGTMGDDLTHLSFPADVHVDVNDNVIIADGGNSRVLKCNASGACFVFVGITGASGDDNVHLSFITSVTTDAARNVYVSDNNNMRVQIFDVAGTYLQTYGETGVPYVVDDQRINRPTGVAATADGGLIVLENKGHRMVKLAANGSQVWTVGEAGIFGSDNDHFGNFNGGFEGNPAVAADGTIFVPDWGNHRIQAFNSDGTFSATYGELGQGNGEFNCPNSVAIDPVNGYIVVADTGNQRVQVFTNEMVYQTTIGVTEDPGDDNYHFNNPVSVAVDLVGDIYVSDLDNNRVQKCTLNGLAYVCETFIENDGEYNNEFGDIHPRSLALDADGNLYVADDANARVQVFDGNGKFITSIGGTESSQMTSSFSTPWGLTVSSEGTVYVADTENHRIEIFNVGVGYVQQVNINGFGDQTSRNADALVSFNDALYAGVYNYETGGQIWRMSSDGNWEQVVGDGFGDSNNRSIYSLAVFDGQIYAGTVNDTGDEAVSNGAQIWRSDTGDANDWEKVVDNGFDYAANLWIYHLTMVGDHLYATTYNTFSGAEVWRTDTGDDDDWENVVTANGFGHPDCVYAKAVAEFNGMMYVGTENDGLWNSSDGSMGSWAEVPVPEGSGWGWDLMPFGNYLYAASNFQPGETPFTKVYRCQQCMGGDWVEVYDPFVETNNYQGSFAVYGNELYLFMENEETGLVVMKSADGTNWETVLQGGFGDSRNIGAGQNGLEVFNNDLYVGTQNGSNGAEVWVSDLNLDANIYLPLIQK